MIVSFDIGGSAIKGGFARSQSDITTLPRRVTPGHDFEAFVTVLREIIAEAPEKPDGIAVSIAGVVDPDTQTLTCANIPCLHGRKLGSDLETALGYPVLIANDADCFAMAEAFSGAGRGHRIVFGAILGTGVGGGLVADGRLVNASGGFAGEWGHGPIVAAFAGTPPVAIPAYPCGCGQTGCVDTIGGARGMERLHALLHGTSLSSEEIIGFWLGGDDKASATLDVYIDLVAPPLALTVNITGATIVPVAGGLSNVEPLLERLDIAVRQRILRKFDRPLVVRSQCRIEPGLIGAAILGLRDVEERRHVA
ncbi:MULTISPECIES: ROK family protein [Rhizobium]|uniref:ROK family protein n=1 Tax=Rhizobium rhododendri TaxID=2506430 RepID=A0ABY8IEK9_9HYPH|nr:MULTISPECIES: ROK family protein [Rhizobium]MBZ5759224.1 ROK family protein [Rhizobium sp. VS19-DR96]MBZ5763945.1 ROK family protein [Rhizobium sp. VS19-DR129.2]MBZ5771489.1 ROK family protein [Rhizobium sp. VS19-DRK62.2]MBZ5783824.1 ROK family protein [Rhizobium sp. VS19-DR121]MBZ5801502.1 ROK family protein [Rhizobium sp. VS19-DR181]